MGQVRAGGVIASFSCARHLPSLPFRRAVVRASMTRSGSGPGVSARRRTMARARATTRLPLRRAGATIRRAAVRARLAAALSRRAGAMAGTCSATTRRTPAPPGRRRRSTRKAQESRPAVPAIAPGAAPPTAPANPGKRRLRAATTVSSAGSAKPSGPAMIGESASSPLVLHPVGELEGSSGSPRPGHITSAAPPKPPSRTPLSFDLLRERRPDEPWPGQARRTFS
jgi:hypothetical protein